MIELINKYGLPRSLKTIFPNLKGIDFEDIIFDHISNRSKPLDYITKNIDNNWYFGIGNMGMVFRTFKTKTERTKILNVLLKNNDIKKADSFKNKANPNITFWRGNGFKIEIVTKEGANIIIITNEDTFTKENLSLRPTDLAKKKSSSNFYIK